MLLYKGFKPSDAMQFRRPLAQGTSHCGYTTTHRSHKARLGGQGGTVPQWELPSFLCLAHWEKSIFAVIHTLAQPCGTQHPAITD